MDVFLTQPTALQVGLPRGKGARGLHEAAGLCGIWY